MYPHERSLVKRLADKSFVLLGINSDENRAEAKKIVEQHQLTWRSWWDGGSTDGPIQTAYDVSHWPTIYVLDHKGVIRYIDVRDEKLDQAVDTLLAELATEVKQK
jgi:peroxiredoxin